MMRIDSASSIWSRRCTRPQERSTCPLKLALAPLGLELCWDVCTVNGDPEKKSAPEDSIADEKRRKAAMRVWVQAAKSQQEHLHLHRVRPEKIAQGSNNLGIGVAEHLFGRFHARVRVDTLRRDGLLGCVQQNFTPAKVGAALARRFELHEIVPLRLHYPDAVLSKVDADPAGRPRSCWSRATRTTRGWRRVRPPPPPDCPPDRSPSIWMNQRKRRHRQRIPSPPNRPSSLSISTIDSAGAATTPPLRNLARFQRGSCVQV